MNEPRLYDTKQIYLQLDNPLQFKLCIMKEVEDFFSAGISDREKMSKALNKYITITALDQADKTFLVYHCHWYTCWNSEC